MRDHAGYGRAYASLESNFRTTYDTLPSLEEQWLRVQEVTIYEYLLLDNYQLGDPSYFEGELTKNLNMNSLDVIRLRARSFLGRWANESRMRGIQSRMQLEKQDFPYAKRRCQKFFRIRSWPRDQARHSEIRLYRRTYFSKLDDEFDRLRVGLA